MARNSKTLALALVAALAMSAIVASAAQAAELETAEFSWGANTNKPRINQDPISPPFKVTTTASAFACDEVHSHAVVRGSGAKTLTKTEITLDDAKTKSEGKLNSCTGPLGFVAAINMNGCHFTLYAGTTTKPSTGETEGTMGIRCPGSDKFIEAKLPACTIKIPEQGTLEEEALGPIAFKNVKTGTKEAITATSEIGQRPGNKHNRGLFSTHTGAVCGSGEDKTGTIEGKEIIEGADAFGNQAGMTVT